MTYTSSEVLTIVAALGVLVAAIGGVMVNIIMALKTDKKVSQGLAMSQQAVFETARVGNKVDQVHVLANNNLQEVRSELAAANQKLASLIDTSGKQIAGLIETVSDLKSEREKVSMATALATMPPRTERRSTDAPTVQDVNIVGTAEPVPVVVEGGKEDAESTRIATDSPRPIPD